MSDMTKTVPQAEHERLGLTFPEWIAFLGTYEWLAGAKHNSQRECGTPIDKHGHEFNMAWACLKEDCGTVSCIGGTMALALGKSTWAYVNGQQETRPALNRLFYPRLSDGRTPHFRTITPVQALKAMDNFRRTGDADWDTVLTAKNFFE